MTFSILMAIFAVFIIIGLITMPISDSIRNRVVAGFFTVRANIFAGFTAIDRGRDFASLMVIARKTFITAICFTAFFAFASSVRADAYSKCHKQAEKYAHRFCLTALESGVYWDECRIDIGEPLADLCFCAAVEFKRPSCKKKSQEIILKFE